jgi:tetratricopeptide (TPR) repeat protein
MIVGLSMTVLVGALLAQAPSGLPRDAKAAYDRALVLDAQGNHAAALSLLWEAAGLAPRDPDVQNRLGEALDRIGALDAAVDAFRAADAARPNFKKASSNLIMTLAKAGRGNEAVIRARSLVAGAPDDADNHFMLGLAQAEHDVQEALASFARAVALAPRHTLARYNRALVLRRLDRLAEAIDELNQTLAIEPRPEAHYTLGVIYWHQGQTDRAAHSLRAAIALAPRHADAHATLGAVLKSQGDLNGAAASLRRAISIQPERAETLYTLAQVLRLAGDEKGAARQLGEADRVRRESEAQREALTWTTVGIQKTQAGNHEGALEDFRRGVASFERYAPAHYQMGLALERLGRAEAARAAFARARALNPSLVSPSDTARVPR